jgi:hypothetical protein
MTSSIERDVENAIAQALTTAGVTGVNIYTSERTSGRLLPFVSIVASIKSEEIAPFTGVFDLNCTITYVARADTISDQAYDQKFASIQQAFYTNPNLASQMTSAQNDLEFYIADITRVGQRIISTSRTWARDVFMDVKVTAKQESPAPIPTNGLSLWLKSDAGVTLDGSDVTAWADQSGNGNDVNDVANMPMLVNNFINGYPAIYFRGTDYLYNSGFTTEGANTFFNVVKFLSGNRVFTSINTNVLIGSYGGYSDRMYNEVWIFEGTSESTDWKLNSAYFGDVPSFYQNGILLGTGGGGNGLAGISIGGHPNWENGAGTAECYHAEVIMYNRQLSEIERQQVESYLNTKYAIY